MPNTWSLSFLFSSFHKRGILLQRNSRLMKTLVFSALLQYKTYKISNGDGGFYSFVFNDTMGLEKDFDAGVMVEDMKLLLGGHVEENYKVKHSFKYNNNQVISLFLVKNSIVLK